MAPTPLRAVLAVCLLVLSAVTPSFAAKDEQVWAYTEPDQTIIYLPDNRKPALYAGNYGDCLGSSLIKVNRFDASFYRDNMTVTFHLGGSTNLTSEALMSTLCSPALRFLASLTNIIAVYIGVFAYGESRFDLTFNPCAANINRYDPGKIFREDCC
jgi:ML-like domain